ncbi:MAG: ABC transporter substrate-binding protein [Dehalococcoidia bacterium]|nr:ABC transporter substrate-binding protein [Dehalococcoidia bacterium]
MTRWFAVLVLGAGLLAALVACSPAAAPAPTTEPKATTSPAAASTPTTQAAAVAATPATKPSPRPLEKIKIQVPTLGVSFLPAYVGKEKGIFREEGLDPEILEIKASLGIPALLKGEIDYTHLLEPSLKAALLGEPVRVVMVQKVKTAWHVILGGGLTSMQQVKGKAVGISTKASANEYACRKGLNHLGLDPDKDITFVVIPSYSDMVTALRGGSLAAGCMSPPFNDVAVVAGLKDVLNTADIVNIVTGGISTTQKRLQENPDQVKRMIRAFLKSMSYVRDHKDEVTQFVTTEYSLEKGIAERVVTGITKEFAYDGAITDQGLEVTLDMWKAYEFGPITETTLEQVKKGLDLTLLKDAQKELGLSR